MTKNNNTTYIIIGIVAIAAFALGAAFSKTENLEQNRGQDASNENSLVGKLLPDVALFDKDGKVYDLSAFKGKNVVLFFNEGLMCYPACWNQIVAFGADLRFNSSDTAAVSVVVDSPQDWQRAVAKMPDLAKAFTLFDTNANTSRRLGLLSAGSSMHAGQLPGHSYVLIDKTGMVREVFDDPGMGINNDKIMEKFSKFN